MKPSNTRAYIPSRLLSRLSTQTTRIQARTRALAYAEVLRDSLPDDGIMRYFGPAIGEGAGDYTPSLTSNSSVSTSGPATPTLSIPTLALIPPSPQLQPSIDLSFLEDQEGDDLEQDVVQHLLVGFPHKKQTRTAEAHAPKEAVATTICAGASKFSPVLWTTHLFPTSADKKSNSVLEKRLATSTITRASPPAHQEGKSKAALISNNTKSTTSSCVGQTQYQYGSVSSIPRHTCQPNSNAVAKQPPATCTAKHSATKPSHTPQAHHLSKEALVQRQRALIQALAGSSPSPSRTATRQPPRRRSTHFVPASVAVFQPIAKPVPAEVIVHVTLSGGIITTPDLACVKLLGGFHPCVTWGCQLCGEHIRYGEWRVKPWGTYGVALRGGCFLAG